MVVLKNGYYLPPEGGFVKGDIAVEGDRIASVGSVSDSGKGNDSLDLNGYRVIPGLIDVHIHGAIGYDAMDATPDQLKELSRFLASNGVTSFFPTTVTNVPEEIYRTLENIKKASEMEELASSIEGVHIEGPYISPKQKGCHNPAWIKLPEIEEYDAFKKILGDKLKIRVTIAPEIPGAMEYINYVSRKGDSITIGHTDADGKTVNEAVENGAVSFTHLFNAMKGIHHREPGTVGAALSGDAYVEIICDGIHVHPDIVKMVYKIKGAEKILLVTDAMHATGCEDGPYVFGGMDIRVTDGIARTLDGTLAGSTLLLRNAIRNFVRFTGAPLEIAVRLATINPAKVAGIDKVTGTIEVGKRADLVVLDNDMEIIYTFSKGRKVYDRNWNRG